MRASAQCHSALISTALPVRGVTTQSPDLGVHPGQLHAGLAGAQQTIRVDPDAVAGAATVPVNDVFEDRIELAQQRESAVARRYSSTATKYHRVGVDGVVFGGLARIRKAVGQHALD